MDYIEEAKRFRFNSSTTVPLLEWFYDLGVRNLVVNCVGVATNLSVLFVGLSARNVGAKQKMPTLCMTLSNLTASMAPFALNVFYLALFNAGQEANFIVCNVFRKLGHHAQLTGIWSVLVVAIDRYFALCSKRDLSRRLLAFFFLLPYLYVAVIVVVEMHVRTTAFDFICGATLEGPFWMTNLTLFVWTVAALAATVLSVLVLRFVWGYSARYHNTSLRRDLRHEKRVAVAVFLQAFLPVLVSVPLLITLVFNYNGIGHLLPLWFTWGSNVSMFAYFALNPLITAAFVRYYRDVLRGLLCAWRRPKTVVSRVEAATTSARRTDDSPGGRF